MPIANAAWQEGRISSRHVDALTKVRHGANADGEFAEFEADARRRRARRAGPKTSRTSAANGATRSTTISTATDPTPSRQQDTDHDRRRANFSRTLDGIGILDGTFDTEGAEIIDTALDRCYERNHHADDPRTPAQQRADAIVDIFRHYLDHQHRGTNRPHLVVAVDDATLAGEAVGRCETISGYQLHPEPVRRLACDAIIQRIVLDSDGVPLDMGRATRTFTPDQYRAIMLRDGGCRMPGCDAGPEDCQAHHATTHWEDGGRTDLDVGLAICRGAGTTASSTKAAGPSPATPTARSPSTTPTATPAAPADPANHRNPSPPEPAATSPAPTDALARAHDSSRRHAPPRHRTS